MDTIQPAREYRYERKFLIERLDPGQVRAILKLQPSLFSEVYPPRFVNNLYLDTTDLAGYWDNLAGAVSRFKVRVRWYGDLYGCIEKPVLEYKMKCGLVGTKLQYPVEPFTLAAGFPGGAFRDALRLNPALPHDVRQHLRGLKVVLLNRYHRSYWSSGDGLLRVTLDSQLSFYNADHLCNTFAQREVVRDLVILELKYRPEHDALAARAAARFPFRITRCSKYLQGVEHVLY